ncbi:Rso55p NDAI_0I01930 [Naumovozyma dairenensis CBS 421]|uniref:Prokaryotic-type class I peptide chain release factors domain-containing protein n=1 Tax=Naumovozyma dairenensis (strain ATCC 10597 / BCRC 20456 / CBS 421 / NBRC 0211 / NRRL Y-12639) TaxID=1071378 RepID=G0WG51_NAUDC|nr:hypothetical protein NDAI_0I01930 [Naumovozyma dairenensis CBS 421]CCD26762.1 hypothetical protein NDAI_0I01930 [Naumovozyma dairenensis CBS 421]
MRPSIIKLFNLQVLPYTLIKKTKLPPRPKFTELMEKECEEKFMHGGRGPGGQKINKCNSKVQLRHMPTGLSISCQETRSREQNRKIAREKMALELERYTLMMEKKVDKDGEDEDDDNEVENTDPRWTITEREQALMEWNREKKRSKKRKGRAKYKAIQEIKEEERLAKLQEEEALLKSLNVNNDL